MTPRAAIHVEHGKPLVVDDIEIPPPNADQVRLKLYSSGVCHSQLHQMHNPETPTPCLLGHEGTGVVTDVGSDVSHVKEGDFGDRHMGSEGSDSGTLVAGSRRCDLP